MTKEIEVRLEAIADELHRLRAEIVNMKRWDTDEDDEGYTAFERLDEAMEMAFEDTQVAAEELRRLNLRLALLEDSLKPQE